MHCKGKTASELRCRDHTLNANRHGLIASAVSTKADGQVEPFASKFIIGDAKQFGDQKAQIAVGADKGYDTAEFV